MDLKIVIVCLLAVTLLATAAAFWLRNNVDRLIKEAIETQGSQLLGAPVRIGAVKISAVDGRGELSNLVIGNPPGFKSPHALKVERIAIALDLASLPKEVVHIQQIEVQSPALIYEMGSSATNFDVIQKNVAANQGKPDKAQPRKRMIVDLFTLRGANAEVSAAFMSGKSVGVPLPDVTLKNIGRDKNGVTAGEFSQLVTNTLIKKLTGAYSFERAMEATGNALGKAGNAIKDLFK